MSYLMHYGKGHLDGGHSGRYRWGSGKRPAQSIEQQISPLKKRPSDIVLKKNTVLARYTSANEKGSVVNTYAFDNSNSEDRRDFGQWAVQGNLGFHKYDKVYKTKINTINDALVRSGRDVCYDLLPSIRNHHYRESLKKLDEIGYLNTNRDWDKLYSVLYKSNGKINKKYDRYIEDARMFVNNYIRNNRDVLVKKYSDRGYDAIIDVNDWLNGNNTPMFLVSDKNLKRKSTDVYFNYSSKDITKNPKVFYDFWDANFKYDSHKEVT